jgi:predicted transcriptional regulator
MKLSEIRQILKAEVIVGEEMLDREVKAGAASDLMSDLLRTREDGSLVLSGLNNLQVVRTAIISGMCAVVIVRGKEPDAEMVKQARSHGLPLLTTPLNMFTACGLLYGRGLRGVGQKRSE